MLRGPDRPRPLFVHMGSVEQGRAFFDKQGVRVAAIADPGAVLYREFGLEQGSLGQLLGPRVLMAALRSVGSGHGAGRAVGDVRQMPGAFLIRGEEIVWRHAYRHAGERPDWDAARALAR